MNSQVPAGTEWIRKAAENFEVVEWYYGQYPNARSLEFSVSDVERMLAALAEVIARNVQSSPEQRGVCDGKHGHYPHPKGICSDPSSWRPFEARPVPQPATERCGDLSFDMVSSKCILEKGHKGYCVFEQPATEPDELKEYVAMRNRFNALMLEVDSSIVEDLLDGFEAYVRAARHAREKS